MKFFMTRKEKGDFLIQVTAWAGLTVFTYYEVTFGRMKRQKKMTRKEKDDLLIQVTT
jgi:hypothetical protein